MSFEDRQGLLGHRSGRITNHYPAAESGDLLDAANQVVGPESRKTPALLVLKKKRLARMHQPRDLLVKFGAPGRTNFELFTLNPGQLEYLP